MNISLNVAEREEPVVIVCVMDRLDRVHYKGEKVLRVVDYKTGKFKEEKMATKQIELTLQPRWEEETKEDPAYVMQTLLYCQAVTEAQRKGLLPKGKILVPALLFTSQAVNEAYSP